MYEPINQTPCCPLCLNDKNQFLDQNSERKFYACPECKLVFVPQAFHLNLQEEKEIYDFHENHPADPGYRGFLARLSEPLIGFLESKSQGLDFGCGPGPTLSLMLEERGHAMTIYDPIYFNDAGVLKTDYDFVCATEVVEHFRQPAEHFEQLFSLVKPGGYLGIMTKHVRQTENFASWHYARDLTHISFYRTETFDYLAKRFGADLVLQEKDVTIFRKN